MSDALVLIDLDSVIHHCEDLLSIEDRRVGTRALSTLARHLAQPLTRPSGARVVVGINTVELRKIRDWREIFDLCTALQEAFGLRDAPALEVATCLTVPQSVDTALVRLLRRSPGVAVERYSQVHLLSRDTLAWELSLGWRIGRILGGGKTRVRWRHDLPYATRIHHQWSLAHPFTRASSPEPAHPKVEAAELRPGWSVLLDTDASVSAAWNRSIDLPRSLRPGELAESVDQRPGLLSQVGTSVASVRGVARFQRWQRGQVSEIGPCSVAEAVELCAATAPPPVSVSSPPTAASVGHGAVAFRNERATLACRLPIRVVQQVKGKEVPLAAGRQAVDPDAIIASLPAGVIHAIRPEGSIWACLRTDGASLRIGVEALNTGPPIWTYERVHRGRSLRSVLSSEVTLSGGAGLAGRDLRIEVGLYRPHDCEPRLVLCASSAGLVQIDAPIGTGRIGLGRCAGHDVAVLALDGDIVPGEVDCGRIQDAVGLRPLGGVSVSQLQELPVVIPLTMPGLRWLPRDVDGSEPAGVSPGARVASRGS